METITHEINGETYLDYIIARENEKEVTFMYFAWIGRNKPKELKIKTGLFDGL